LTTTKFQSYPLIDSSPVKGKRKSNLFNFENQKEEENLILEESETNKTIKAELDELFRFIEKELQVQSLLAAAQDSTQFSSCSSAGEENLNQSLNKGESDSEAFGVEKDESHKLIVHANDDIFVSEVTKAKKAKKNHPGKKPLNAQIIERNIDKENYQNLNGNENIPCGENNNKRNNNNLLVKNEVIKTKNNNNDNNSNNFNNNNYNKNNKVASSLKTDKKFSSSQKKIESSICSENQQAELKLDDIFEKAQKSQHQQAKEDFKNIFLKIENKLRNYLKESYHQKIFESKAFESFLNEQKLKTPCSFTTPKSQTPSIIKNFFEDKEVIEVTKKRHTLAGEGLKNQLEKLHELEFKQKCFSNFREPQSLLRLKHADAAFIDRKKSDISDFSVNISDYSECSGFDALAYNEDANSSENTAFTYKDGNNVAGRASAHRISGIKLSKRGSILRERISNLNSNCAFAVVHEEERIVDLDESGSQSADDGVERNEHKKEESE